MNNYRSCDLVNKLFDTGLVTLPQIAAASKLSLSKINMIKKSDKHIRKTTEIKVIAACNQITKELKAKIATL